MANRVDDVTLNFTLNARAVEQAGQALQKELERGLGAVNFDHLRRNADKTFKQMGGELQKALNQKVAIDTTTAMKQLSDLNSKKAALERSLAAESHKAVGKEAFLRQRMFQKYEKMEKALIKQKERAMVRLNKLATKHVGIMKKGQGGGGGFLQSMGFGGKGKAGGGALKGAGNMLGGAGKMASTMGKMAPVMSTMGGALGTVVAGLGAAATGIGVVVGALTGLVAIIGAAVGVFAALAAIAIGADSKMKDLNKTATESIGGLDLLHTGYMNVGKQLDNIRHAAVGAQFALGSLAKDNIAILKTLHEHGETVRELSKDYKKAAMIQGAYQKSMGLVLTTARLIGENATTMAEKMATSADDLGLSLETVAKKFSTIGRYAMESGFSTKRFFSMVIQATSGMSMYNVRLEEASGLLVRIGKILGQKTGGEFLSSLSKGFVDKSMTDRIKTVKLAGTGNTKNAFDKSATNTARDFQGALTDSLGGKGFDLSKLGVAGMSGDVTQMSTEDFRKELQKLSPEDQALAIANFSKEMTKANAADADKITRKLTTLIDVEQGAKGGLLNMSKELGNLDMGGKLNMLRHSMASMFPGKEIHELSALQLAALESATGMQGEQLHTMRRLTRGLQGNFEALQKGQIANTEEEKEAQIKAFGAFKNAQGEIVKGIINEKGKAEAVQEQYIGKDGKTRMRDVTIKDLDEYVQSRGESVEKQQAAMDYNEDQVIQQQIRDGTFKISDMIEAGIAVILNKIYGVVQALLDLFDTGGEKRAAVARQASYYDAAKKATEEGTAVERSIEELKQELIKAGGDATKEAEIKTRIKQAEIVKEALNESASLNQMMGEAVFNADGSISSTADLGSEQAAEFSSELMQVMGGFGAIVGMDTNTQSRVSDDAFGQMVEKSTGKFAMANKAVVYDKLASDPRFADRLQIASPKTKAHIEAREQGTVRMSEEDTTQAQERRGRNDGTISEMTQQRTYNEYDHNRIAGEDNFGEGANVYDEVGGDYFEKIVAMVTDKSGNKLPLSMEGVTGVYSDASIPDGFDKGWGTFGGNTGEIPLDRYRDDQSSNWHMGQSDGQVSELRQRDIHDNYSTNYVDRGTARQSLGETYGVLHVGQEEVVGSSFSNSLGSNTRFDSSQRGRDIAFETTQYQPSVPAQHELDQYGGRLKGGGAAVGLLSLLGGNEGRNASLMSELPTKITGTGGGSTETAGQEYQGKDWVQMLTMQMQQYINGGQGEEGAIGSTKDDLAKALEEGDKNKDGVLTFAEWRDWMQNNRQTQFKKMDDSIKEEQQMNTYLKDLLKWNKEQVEKDKSGAADLLNELVGGGSTTKRQFMRGGRVYDNASGTGAKLKELMLNPVIGHQVKQLMTDLNIAIDKPAEDFVYRGGSRGGVITPINTKDEFLGMKPGGAISQAFASSGGGGGTINVNVYSDVDVEKVKRAVYQAGRQLGIGGRGKTRAGQGNFGKKV